MKKGCYRLYFHIGKIGFKIPRYNYRYGNAFCGFLTGIIMNFLERRRYKYYVKKKKYFQWNSFWKYEGKRITCLAPCYFSCGLLNIVKHIPNPVNYDDLGKSLKEIESKWSKKTGHILINDIKPENFRKDDNGKIYCVDYGEFTTGGWNRTSVVNIDYK